MTEDKMIGWHHQLVGHEFEQAPGFGDGQGGLVCCSPWDCKEPDVTEVNWKLLLYAENMVLYIENPQNATQKLSELLELINRFCKVAEYKINKKKISLISLP